MKSVLDAEGVSFIPIFIEDLIIDNNEELSKEEVIELEKIEEEVRKTW